MLIMYLKSVIKGQGKRWTQRKNIIGRKKRMLRKGKIKGKKEAVSNYMKQILLFCGSCWKWI